MGFMMQKHGTTLNRLKPVNIVQAAEADLKLRERKRNKTAEPGALYSFARKHVQRANNAGALVALAYFDPEHLISKLRKGAEAALDVAVKMEKARDDSELLGALREILPILEAVRYTVGLRGNQLERMERAKKAIANAEAAALHIHYEVMREDVLNALPVCDLAADDCVLFLWTCWPVLQWSLRTIEAWGFEYKTCGFCWVKAHAGQIEMFQADIRPHMTLGYWTRSNSEVCLLATRGKPKRIATDVRQAIIEPRREHSRKPDDIHARIERLVAGPYLELFARQKRPGWTIWGNQTDKFAPLEAAE